MGEVRADAKQWLEPSGGVEATSLPSPRTPAITSSSSGRHPEVGFILVAIASLERFIPQYTRNYRRSPMRSSRFAMVPLVCGLVPSSIRRLHRGFALLFRGRKTAFILSVAWSYVVRLPSDGLHGRPFPLLPLPIAFRTGSKCFRKRTLGDTYRKTG